MKNKFSPSQSMGKWDHLILEMTPLEIAKFWSNVTKLKNGCWIKGKGKIQRSYVTFKGKSHLASRVAWIILKGKIIPKGKEICHTCDNGKCVAPEHIKAKTHNWNMRDMYAKGRNSNSVGCLTEFDIHSIRIQYKKLLDDYVPKTARKILTKKYKISESTVARIIYKYGKGFAA